MRWIYISPHLDDAVLSAGGFLYEQARNGVQVEIWTVVCGFPPPGELTPFAQVLHHVWGSGTAEETVQLRRAEDLEAARIIGAKAIHFDIPDCIYRRGPDGEPLYLEIYTQPHAAEAHIPGEIAQTLAPRLRPEDQVICQLGVGDHIDHIMVRQAAEGLNRPLWYAADLPYLFKQPGELAPLVAGMDPTLHTITEAGLTAWVDAVLAYESQLSSLFERKEQVDEQIRSFYAERGGFPLWQISPKVT